uniref:Uncharacterized protein n=1 Tax=viral metagenome TaxID=1070528 RepID=A0A6H1ZWX8_9ZZZZ
MVVDIPDRAMTHLRPSERSLFRRFLALDPIGEALYDFDVRLGEGMPLDPTWPDWLSRMASALTQRRADVVAHTTTEDFILEIKDRAGTTAIGQLLCYRALYLRDFKPTNPVRLGVITPRLGFDLEPVFSEFDIRAFLV